MLLCHPFFSLPSADAVCQSIAPRGNTPLHGQASRPTQREQMPARERVQVLKVVFLFHAVHHLLLLLEAFPSFLC